MPPGATGLVRYKGLADGQIFNQAKQEPQILLVGHICKDWNQCPKRTPAVRGLVPGKGLAAGIAFTQA